MTAAELDGRTAHDRWLEHHPDDHEPLVEAHLDEVRGERQMLGRRARGVAS